MSLAKNVSWSIDLDRPETPHEKLQRLVQNITSGADAAGFGPDGNGPNAIKARCSGKTSCNESTTKQSRSAIIVVWTCDDARSTSSSPTASLILDE